MWVGVGLVLLAVVAFFSPRILRVKETQEIFERGKKHYEKLNYEEASKEFLRVLIKRPDREELIISTLIYLSHCYANLEKYDLAAKCLERLIKDHPKDPRSKEAVFYLANLCIQKGDYDNALEMYDRSLKSITDIEFIIDTKFQMAYCHFQKGNYSKAKDILETVKIEYPSQLIPLEAKFLELYARVDSERKKESVEEIEKSTPTVADYAYIVDIIEGRAKEKIVDKKEDKRKIQLEERKRKEEKKQQYSKAVELYRNRQMFRSTEILKNLIEKYPEDGKSRALLEKIIDEMRYTRDNFYKLQRLSSARGGQRLTERDLHYVTGYMFYIEGKNDKAIECLKKILIHEPGNEEILEFINRFK